MVPCLIFVAKSNIHMSHGPIDPSAEGRATQSCPWVARRAAQHGGGSDDVVAGIRPIKTASLSVSASGTGSRSSCYRACCVGPGHAQDPEPYCGRSTCSRQDQWFDHGRDRGARRVDIFVGGKEAWLSDGPRNAAMFTSTMSSTACSPPSFTRSTNSSCRSMRVRSASMA